MLKKIFASIGYQIIPISHDPVLNELINVYRQLLNSSKGIERQNRLAKIASLGHLKDLLQTHQIETVIDVGANIGQFGLSLRKVGFKGKILSFEPMRQARDKLEVVAAAHPPWKVFSNAIGSCYEKKNLTIFKDDSFSSLHAVTKSGRNIFGSYVQNEGEELVQVETLDRITDITLKGEIHGPLMLKTDTQGHDLEVLKGGLQLLMKTSVIMSEAAIKVIYEGAPAFEEVLSFLRKNNFEASGFYPFSNRPENLEMVEFDAFFVRKLTET